jgi:hypothetical protein
MIGGLAFSGAPKLIGHIGLGHLTLLYAVAWMPWLLLLVRHAVESSRTQDRHMLRSGALAGGVLGLIFLADPRWAIPSAMLALAFGLRVLHVIHASARARTRAALALLGLGAGSALAISAGLALPLAEYVSLTTRAVISPADANTLALPASRLLGYLIPDLGGPPEWMTYVGIGVLYLALLAIVGRGRGAWFWLAAAALSTLLAMGDNLPVVWTVIRWIPGAGLLRVPSRFLLISAFSLAVLAGLGAHVLLQPRTEESSAARLRLITLAFGALIALLAGGIYLVAMRAGNLRLESSAALAAGTAVAVGVWILAGLGGRLTARSIGIGLALLLLAELGVVNRSTLELHPAVAVLNERQDLALQARQLAAGMRIFSPSYSLPQQTAERDRLELADGVGPLQLRSYRDSMARATGFSTAAYSVTLPPFPTGNPGDDWRPVLDPELLGRWDVGVVVADYPVETSGLIEQAAAAGVHVYRNPSSRPRAWVEQDDGKWSAAGEVTWTPNRIDVTATGPGTLVLSENAYPGWGATVDSTPSQLQTNRDGMRSLALSPGEHKVRLEFHPVSVYVGAAISLLGALALGMLWLRR